MTNNLPIVISCGEPFGLSYQALIKALSDIKDYSNLIIVGHYQIFQFIQNKMGSNLNFSRISSKVEMTRCDSPVFVAIDETIPYKDKNIVTSIGKKTLEGAKIALRSLKTALEVMKKFKLPVLVTMPVCKETIMKIHPGFLGQTEFLADYFSDYHVKNVYQAYISDELLYTLLTAHIPLSKVKNHIKARRIEQLVSSILNDCRIFFDGILKLGILCINPHCGEFLNTKEEDIIKQCVNELQKKGLNIIGPFTFEYSVKLFKEKKINVCIGIYHDQVITPLKILTRNNLSELNIGLPIRRVGPVHGVGFDRANEFNPDYTSTIFTLKTAQFINLNLELTAGNYDKNHREIIRGC